jgi:release factor glutamine methyltransferase
VSEVAHFLAAAADDLRRARVESPRLEARLLLAHALDVTPEDIIAGGSLALDTEARARFDALIARRAAREPIAYILGRREFWSLGFAVGPGVLIPRPESEILVEKALSRCPDRGAELRVLDLGTGSGCLLLAFLSERPNAEGVGIDISPDALVFAARNAKTLGLADRATLVRGRWMESLKDPFDVIFVNPPYIRGGEIAGLDPDVACYEPNIALNGGADGLDAYRQIAAQLRPRLSPAGFALFEIGAGQQEDVKMIFTAHGLCVEGTICDLAGISRCIVVSAPKSQARRKKQLAMETRSG